MWKQVGLGIIVLIVALVVFAATRPDEYRVERSTTIDRAPEVVFGVVRDFHHFPEWSPWQKLDPEMKTVILGTGVGSSYEWHGNNDVGNGKLVITEEVAPVRVAQTLTFLPPWEADATAGFDLVPLGSGTRVTWWMAGEFDFPAKVFDIFVSMDSMVGGDYQNGLANLKTYVESRPPAALAPAQLTTDSLRSSTQ